MRSAGHGFGPVGLALLLAASAGPAHATLQTPPVVSLRYTGGPDGTPDLNDLAAIAAVGFDAVAWPSSRAAALPDVRRLAESVGLAVAVLPDAAPLSPAQARKPPRRITVALSESTASVVTPLVWRAVAHGARVVVLDPGAAAVSHADGRPAAWVAPALAISRHLTGNRRLVDVMRAGPNVVVDAAPGADVDVVLLDGGRAWVLIATSLSAAPTRAKVTFSKGIPSGLWASWIDDSAMSMLYQPTGPVWNLTLDAYGIRVYFIDKSRGNFWVS